MLGDLGGWHLLIILAVVLLLFGATKLPALSRGIGQSIRIFRSEMKPEPDTIEPRPEPAARTTDTGEVSEAKARDSADQ
jgi:sec-independent protein translocase protein TatA